MDKSSWVKLFKKTFRFTGGEIAGEFLMSIGFLPGAHDTSCTIYKKILKLNPMWLQNKQMDIKTIINKWIAAGNSYDSEKYLDFYTVDAVLDDPSVGRIYKGRKEIRQYFDSYFIGYKTQTKLISIEALKEDQAHVEVKFTGDFPEGNIGGIFDITFKEGKIVLIKADLLH